MKPELRDSCDTRSVSLLNALLSICPALVGLWISQAGWVESPARHRSYFSETFTSGELWAVPHHSISIVSSGEPAAAVRTYLVRYHDCYHVRRTAETPTMEWEQSMAQRGAQVGAHAAAVSRAPQLSLACSQLLTGRLRCALPRCLASLPRCLAACTLRKGAPCTLQTLSPLRSWGIDLTRGWRRVQRISLRQSQSQQLARDR